MINSSKEVDSPRKQEGGTDDVNKVVKASASSSSTPWLRLRDPRIVRVSRALGGKDRHSKVCTMRGLRDRRVRLSVPTAIQLYDLQDRLGLNQPSKVVDWLLNAAKDEIDVLPPLPMPPGTIGLDPAILSSYHGVGAAATDSNKEGLKMNNSVNNWQDQGGLPGPNIWNSDALLRAKSKEVAADSINEKGNWMKRNEEDKEDGNSGGHRAHVSSINLLSRGSHSSPAGMANNNNNNAAPYGSFFQLEPSNFPMSQLASHGLASQSEDLHNSNIMPLPSTLSLSSGSQIFLCQPGTTTQSYFPSHVTASAEIDPRQISHFQMLNPSSSTQNLLPNSLTSSPFSISQSMRPFHFSVTSRPLHAHTIENEADKDQDFPSK